MAVKRVKREGQTEDAGRSGLLSFQHDSHFRMWREGDGEEKVKETAYS